MAEQGSHDVVEQTLSGGGPSPSGVPASTNDKQPAGGDVRETVDSTTTAQNEAEITDSQSRESASIFDTEGKVQGNSSADNFKPGPGPVESRALELNGLSSVSDVGEDSQGGSESDASRTDSRQHARTGSSKKAATFKPVSFAKFSVPKAPGNPAGSKGPDKVSLSPSPVGMSALQSGSRPRLVAKTTSSLRDSLLKTATSSAKLGGTGPDPNQVWNKNRPAQSLPPKHLTDEELKQQYGIHMTSRIQEDGGGTEAKWADIDDDEDDWAPETIEWTDGTKVTLTTHTEPPPLPSQETPTPQESKSEHPQQAPTLNLEPMRIIPKPTTSIGPNATVLRLGASAERQAKVANTPGKGFGDRFPPTSTSSAPVPSRSPWAPLPPVEKVSPMMAPAQVRIQPLPKASIPENRPPEAGNGPAILKEIAADDFNRTWRDNQSAAPRELYNSRSGRYEPVAETKKGTWRADQNFRPPSLLQRQPPNDHAGAAEPSSAFQTHRLSGGEGPSWTRRRTSSNVSGGSGSFGRRMSSGRIDGPPQLPEQRGKSQVNGTVDLVSAPRDSMLQKPGSVRGVSPVHHAPSSGQKPHNATAESAALEPAASAISDDSTSGTAFPAEDPVVMQERIMKEKRLEARRRRLEQEEREEAEKQERIRLKLEALGPAPEKPKPKADDVMNVNKPEVSISSPTKLVQSPPKPPIPEPSGEPKQYGMMKVHHPETVKKFVIPHETAPTHSSHTRHISSPGRESRVETIHVNGVQPLVDQVHEKQLESKQDDKGPHWRSNLAVSASYSPWSANSKLGGAPPVLANPWKPLSTDKTLGNGIFEQSIGSFPGRELPLRGHIGLDQQPISLPVNTGDRIANSQTFPITSRASQESVAVSTLPSPEARCTSYDALSPISRPAPIGPPSSQNQWPADGPRPNGTAAWNNFHSMSAQKEMEEGEKLRQEMTTIRDRPSALQVSFNETWKQVRPGDHFSQRQIIGTERAVDSNVTPASRLPGFDHSGLSFAENHQRPLGTLSVRGSRFFPPAPEQLRKNFSEEESICFQSPSPPPPEEVSSHPVFTGDSNRPLVHLPAPKPRVKLPPQITAHPPPRPTFASMAAASASRPISANRVSTTTSWQEKFNGLFGKKSAVEKKTALQVSSASKEPLDVQMHLPSVSVSLPQYADVGIAHENGEFDFKQFEEEEAMFEDREVGSLPVVRVPDMAPPAAWHAAPPPPPRLRSKNLKPMQVHSIEPYSVDLLDADQTGNNLQVSVRFPGSALAKILTIARKSGGNNTPKNRSSSNFRPRKNHQKVREGSGNFGMRRSPGSQLNNGSTTAPRQLSANNTSSWGTRSLSSSGH